VRTLVEPAVGSKRHGRRRDEPVGEASTEFVDVANNLG
jgi:hypothetical protein